MPETVKMQHLPHPDILEVLLTEEQIARKVKELGERISRDYKGKEVTLISVLKGSVVFLADLCRHLQVTHRVDFMAVSSYGGETESSGVVRLIMDLRESPEGRNILIVEDLVDTGLTLNYLRENLMTRKPSSLKICTLLDKPQNRRVEVTVDYKGFDIPNKFVVGYGLDYKELYRNLPYVGVLKPGVYRR